MIDFLIHSVEYTNWGFNVLIFCSIGLFFVTLYIGRQLWDQSKDIWEKESAEALSLKFFSYNCFSGFSYFCLGYYHKNISIMINGLVQGILYIPIIIGIIKYNKDLKKSDYILSVMFSLMILAMIIFPKKDTIFTLIAIGTLFVVENQVSDIHRKKSTGVFHKGMVKAGFVGNVFWAIDFFWTKKFLLGVFNLISAGILIFVIKYWNKKYQKPIILERIKRLVMKITWRKS